MRKRKKWTARPFESQGQRFTDPFTGAIRTDTSANLYESMMLSPAFQDLTNRQKLLYLVAKAQFFGHRKPEQDFPDIEQVKGDDCFYLNLGSVTRYGLYTRNMRGKFYSDIKALESHGFVKTLSSGKTTKSKSIYKFCPDWKYWTIEDES